MGYSSLWWINPFRGTNTCQGVPSAAEVVEQAINAAKMDTKLLEEIEELTLYSIQLENSDQELIGRDKQRQQEIEELRGLVKLLLEKK